MRAAILISGGGSNMVALADAMISGKISAEPALVLSNRGDAGGLQKADRRGIRTVVVDHRRFPDRGSFETALDRELQAADVDMICLAGFMRVLTADFVGRWSGRMVNIHPSLLPSFRGLNTHARAIAAGVAVHGCTVHEVTPELDDGPIIGQAMVPVDPEDDAGTLAARVLQMEHRLYPACVEAFVQGARRPLFLSGDQTTS